MFRPNKEVHPFADPPELRAALRTGYQCAGRVRVLVPGIHDHGSGGGRHHVRVGRRRHARVSEAP